MLSDSPPTTLQRTLFLCDVAGSLPNDTAEPDSAGPSPIRAQYECGRSTTNPKEQCKDGRLGKGDVCIGVKTVNGYVVRTTMVDSGS